MKPAPGFPLKAHRAGNHADFQSECVAFFAEAVQIFGVPKSIGQIYGLLYASPEPLSFSDIVERLEISKGSASQGLQLLRSLGAVKPVSRSYSLTVRQSDGATARDYYEPELGLRRLLGGIIRGRIEPLAGQGRLRMRRLRELAEATADGAHKEFQLERVEQLETWRRQVTLLLPVLKTLLLSPRR
jgi:DNA-binding transcriptional ArsR family regulator